MKEAIKLGVTGGIGSGKSYVCKLLETHFHIPVYYTDNEAKRLNEEDPVIRQGLIELLGPEIYGPDNKLNRPKLADYLFASPQHAAVINNLIHPRVKEDFCQWSLRQEAPIVAMECAILFESGFHTLVDHTLLIQAPLEIRIERVCKRDQTDTLHVKQRMDSQLPEEEKAAQADFTLTNDGKCPILPQLQNILARL